MSKSYLDKTGVGTLSSLMKKEIKNTVESTKEQLFVVTVTPKGKPTEREYSTLTTYTPSATFEEAVAQAKSGKKVVLRSSDGGVQDIPMYLHDGGSEPQFSSDLFSSIDSFKDTFVAPTLYGFVWHKLSLYMEVMKVLPSWLGDTKPTYTASEVGADASGAAAQALTDAKEWVTGKGYQTAEQVSTAIENAKEQLFVVTVTFAESNESGYTITQKLTPSVTLEEAVAQAKSGKKVIIGPDGADLDTYVRMFLVGDDILMSDRSTNLMHSQNIKTFATFMLQQYIWDSSSLRLEAKKTLPKWIGDTKPTYTASEVGAATKPKRVSVTLKAYDWDTSKKTQTVTVMGVSADESAQVIQPIPALASRDGYNTFGIRAIGQAKNSITFIAGIIPASDLNVYIVITEVTA